MTSPPYWGLRSYLPSGHPLKHLEIGSEPTLELYVEHIVEAFRSVRRVLRDDGTLVVNMGDGYCNDTKWGGSSGGKNYTSVGGGYAGQRVRHGTDCDPKRGASASGQPKCKSGSGLKPKDLLMQPARVAMALQSDGWTLRSQIPWIKRNSMPESCTDRPAMAVEYVFLFSKGPNYYWDRCAVMMPVSLGTHARMSQNIQAQLGSDRANGGQKTNGRMKAVSQGMSIPGVNPKAKNEQSGDRTKEGFNGRWKAKQNASFAEAVALPVSARNRRNSDWFMESWQGLMTDDEGEPLALIINPKGTTIPHFASYPPKLVEPFIKACTSERGCCPKCGACWARIVEQGAADIAHQRACGGDEGGLYGGQATKHFGANGVQNASDVKRRILAGMREKKTVDWKPSCNCYASDDTPNPIPCTVLDNFGGTGCTSMVATNHGRRSISCELSPEYFTMSSIRDGQGGLL